MKIISPGVKFRSFRHTCNACGAILEVEESDIKCHYYAGDQCNRPETTFSAMCPCCEYPFVVDEGKLTTHLKTKLLKVERGW